MKHTEAKGRADKTANGDASRIFGDFANVTARAAGRPLAFVIATVVIVVWAVTGPIFGFSDTWQLIINTGTTVVTFLMVFIIQNSQNRDNAAIQVKLDELIRASAAQNFYIGIESLTDEEIDAIKKKCEERAKHAERSVGRKAHDAADAASGV